MSGLPWVALWRRRRDLNPHGFPHHSPQGEARGLKQQSGPILNNRNRINGEVPPPTSSAGILNVHRKSLFREEERRYSGDPPLLRPRAQEFEVDVLGDEVLPTHDAVDFAVLHQEDM